MGGGEEDASVIDGLRVAEVSVIEANPVGIVENPGPSKRVRESLGVVEVEGMDFDSISEGVFAIG
jgi:hypothetical protein